MDIIQTAINAAVVLAVGVLITFVTRGQTQELKQDLREFKREVKQDFGDVKQDFRDVRQEIANLRSDLTQVALAVGVKPRPQVG